jgi:1-deoxy-D-xylulose-5-phosphate synthase
MPAGTGLNIFRKAYPTRFFDVGIAEGNAVGIASGLARGGLKPVVAIYSTFLQRAFDQIIHDVALQNLGVIFAIDRAGFVGEDGPTHHGIFDVNYLRMIPHVVSMAPKDKEEFEDMLQLATNLDGPVAVRYPKGESFSLSNREEVVFGRAQVLEQGSGVCILALGSLVVEAIRASEFLKREGIHPLLVNARFIKPLDEVLLEHISAQCKLVVVVEEGMLEGGFGSGVLEFYERRNMLDKITIKRLGIADEFPPFATRETLLQMYCLDGEGIYQETLKALKQEALWHR